MLYITGNSPAFNKTICSYKSSPNLNRPWHWRMDSFVYYRSVWKQIQNVSKRCSQNNAILSSDPDGESNKGETIRFHKSWKLPFLIHIHELDWMLRGINSDNETRDVMHDESFLTFHAAVWLTSAYQWGGQGRDRSCGWGRRRRSRDLITAV